MAPIEKLFKYYTEIDLFLIIDKMETFDVNFDLSKLEIHCLPFDDIYDINSHLYQWFKIKVDNDNLVGGRYDFTIHCNTGSCIRCDRSKVCRDFSGNVKDGTIMMIALSKKETIIFLKDTLFLYYDFLRTTCPFYLDI